VRGWRDIHIEFNPYPTATAAAAAAAAATAETTE